MTLEPLEGRALLSTWTVNSLGDSGTGSGISGDLRYVITQANQTPGNNTINFDVTGTITLNSALPDLSNTTGLTDIEGPGASSLTVARSSAAGTPYFGVFTVDSSVTASLAGLTISGGLSASGGGISDAGTLTVTNSTIDNNSAGFGVGIYSAGTVTVTNSAIAGNTAGEGGGIDNEGTVTFTSSTIADNSANEWGSYYGGGLWAGGPTTLLGNTLIALNTSDAGSGATADDISLNLGGTGSLTGAYNLIGIGGSGGLVNGTNGNQVGVADPGLDPNGLQNNGGPTQTIALVTGSPAIDAGSNALAVDLTTDQRGTGFPRVANGTVDIGAYEVQSYITAVAVGWGTQTAALQTASDGLRLLPAGRNTDLPWVGISQVQITLGQAATLAAGDISAIGSSGTNYGPVTVSGSGTSYMITLSQPITAADRVTITIGNATLATFTRRLDVLPGDVNDDGVVNVQDMVAIRNQILGYLGAVPTIFGDINGDGKVDIYNYTAARKRIGTHL